MGNHIFSIDKRQISRNHPPYVIAEISAIHNGSINRAKDTIIAAKNSGVSAVKIQTYTPDTMTINSNNDDFVIKHGLWKNRVLYDLYKEAYTPFEWHEELFQFAAKNDITLFSSPFDESAVDLLDSLNAPAFKVASFEIVDLPLIKYIASKNKPMILSTGMASIAEIGNAIDTAYSQGNKNIALLHCVSAYPAELSEANLMSIKYLKKQFDVEVGLSDHSNGILASVIAVSLGANIIEKHFTLDRGDGGVDSEFSLEPHEMSELVTSIGEVPNALGESKLVRSQKEVANKAFRRSIYFVKDIKKGEIITHHHIRRIRPGFGLAPMYYDDILGKVCLKSASKAERVTFEHYVSDQNIK